MNASKRVRMPTLTALAMIFGYLLAATPVHGQNQVDVLQEISGLQAEATALHAAAEQLKSTLQSMVSAAGGENDRRTDGRSPGAESRYPYIQQCCRSAYDTLATGVARTHANFQTLNRVTGEYQRRPLAQAFGTANANQNDVTEAMAGVASAPDLTGTLRAVEIRLVPALQTLLPALEHLHQEATSQLAIFPFYLLSVGRQGGFISNSIEAAPGEHVVFQVRIDAAMTPEPVFPGSPLTVFASVPHRFEGAVDFQAPLTLPPGQHAEATFVAEISPDTAVKSIPITFRLTGDLSTRQQRGLVTQVTVQVRHAN